MIDPKFKEFQKRIVNLYIEHPDVQVIWEMLDTRRLYRSLGVELDSDESQINLFITGKPRVGKTQAMKRYVKRYPKSIYIDPKGREIDVKPVAFMRLPVPFTAAAFYNNIVKAVGQPAFQSNEKVDFIKTQAFYLLQIHKVEMLIIDEMDYLLANTYTNKKAAMELIKDVTNESDVCLVCVGTPAIEQLRTLNDQLIGRFPQTTLPWFKQCDEQFFELLSKIETQLAPEVPLRLTDPDIGELLYELSGGLMGWLKPIIRESFKILGIFRPQFDTFSVLDKFDADVLIEARERVLGQLNEKDLERITRMED
ncbi:TniB family NTP-binding protein [Paenibacillus sp. WQ 127069]|uniref:TniB family NTP-binding protein n=1 Tax=Paenibacillus baimaensis TaxID=2982185 RepID=A0ABT2UJP4_9BACL|nr:TniB family NTP-binding protein [Paenibacillus sp. WQ 127069]MCU6794860.1 TniB family NTP-binding protein [Paenibacillus sp. WQ 127069]